MTNGGKLQSIFPNLRITLCESYVQVMSENYEFSNTYPLKWWNAEYKNDKVDCEHTDCNNCVNHKYCDYESNKSEIPTSSDCVDRHSVDLLAYRYLKEATDNHVAFYEDFLDLPSVTPIRPKGHWIVNKEKDTICCSCCNDKQKIGKDEVELLNIAFTGFRFCRYCGSDNREVRNDNSREE